MRLRTILIAIGVMGVCFFISLKAMDWLPPGGGDAPKLVELPPLPAVPRTSTIIAPVAITLNAIRDAADRGTPRNCAATAPTPVEQILQNADIRRTPARRPITATAAPDEVARAAPST